MASRATMAELMAAPNLLITTAIEAPPQFQRTDGLLVPQGNHRIDAHGAASRDVTGGQRNAEQNDRHRSESHWIGCGNTIEQARHEARQQKRRN